MRVNPVAEYFKSLGWVLLLLYLFLGLVALAAGRSVGYALAGWCCAALGIAVSVVFAAIVLLNVAVVGTVNLARRLLARDGGSAHGPARASRRNCPPGRGQKTRR